MNNLVGKWRTDSIKTAGAARCLSSSLNRLDLPADALRALGIVLAAFTLTGLDGLLVGVFNGVPLGDTNSVVLEVAAFEDLNHASILVRGAELVLQSGFAGSVQDTLSTVAKIALEVIR